MSTPNEQETDMPNPARTTRLRLVLIGVTAIAVVVLTALAVRTSRDVVVTTAPAAPEELVAFSGVEALADDIATSARAASERRAAEREAAAQAEAEAQRLAAEEAAAEEARAAEQAAQDAADAEAAEAAEAAAQQAAAEQAAAEAAARAQAPSSTTTTAPRDTERSAAVAATGIPDSYWDRMAACETGGNWAHYPGARWSGGLGMYTPEWMAISGGKYGPSAGHATRAQQIEIANQWVEKYGGVRGGGLSGWGCLPQVGYP